MKYQEIVTREADRTSVKLDITTCMYILCMYLTIEWPVSQCTPGSSAELCEATSHTVGARKNNHGRKEKCWLDYRGFG